MPNTVFLIEIVGFFSRTIGFADSLYAAVGMFHGKQMPQTGHWTKGVPERYVSRETNASNRALDERSTGKVCFTGNICFAGNVFALYSGIVRLQKNAA